MNRFYVFPSIQDTRELPDYEGEVYSGKVVPLACVNDINFILFFPCPEKHAQLIDTVLKEDPKKYNYNTEIIGIYRTMLDSWKVSGRYLSGIILDVCYDKESDEDVISSSLIISNENGLLDSIVKVNFINAITLAALERHEILITHELLSLLVPQTTAEEEDNPLENLASDIPNASNTPNAQAMQGTQDKYPVDNDILEVAKKIMSGKIKEQDHSKKPSDDKNKKTTKNSKNKRKP